MIVRGKNINGGMSMNREIQRTERYFGSGQKTVVQLPPEVADLERFKEQAIQATGQEIADLYTMLQFKCKHGVPRLSGFYL
jgi:hypothetical protein